jgi:hypothetical protein
MSDILIKAPELLNLPSELKNRFTGLLLWKPKPEPITLLSTLKNLILMLSPARPGF